MNNVDYYVLTQLIVDDIAINDKILHKNILGGGVYTVAGARIWSNSVGFATGIGKDFNLKYSKWFVDNSIDTSSMIVKHNRTSLNYVNYFDDGEREEIPVPETGSLELMQLTPSELPESYNSYRGVYIFKNLDEKFWEETIPYLKSNDGISVWEIFGESANYKNRNQIRKILGTVDLFSLNLTEGKNLTGKEDPIEILEDIISLGAKNTIFRMGENGALVTDGESIWHVPAVKTSVVDVTGGGNSSTGAYLVGWVENDGDPVKAACCASVAASFIIEQYGPPQSIDSLQEERDLRFEKLIKMVKKIR